MDIPKQIHEKIKQRAREIATGMGYLNASIKMRGTIIDSLVNHPDVGKMLENYINKTKTRSHIKDNILRAFSQEQFQAYPVEAHIAWCKKRYGLENLIVINKECSNPRRAVYWLKDETTKFSIFVSECAYKSWESAIRSALLFIAKNKAADRGEFRILLSLSTGQMMVSESDECFLRNALSVVDIDLRIARMC